MLNINAELLVDVAVAHDRTGDEVWEERHERLGGQRHRAVNELQLDQPGPEPTEHRVGGALDPCLEPWLKPGARRRGRALA